VKVIRAEAMGLCFGVRRALEAAMMLRAPGEVTIDGELVHNEEIQARLARRGFSALSERQRGEMPPTRKVLVTAHGISERRRGRLVAAGKELIDLTCPLVRRVHQAAQALRAEGRLVLLIGKRGHVEVQGVVEDLDRYEVIEHPGEVRPYEARRLGIVCQSTTPPRTALRVRKEIHALNPGADIRAISTICRPTRDRQYAVLQLLRRVEAMVVVGGRNSNNTRQLVELAESYRVPCLHVQDERGLERAWLERFQTVGLTAGTSTPDEVIERVDQRLRQMPSRPGRLAEVA